MRFEYNLWFSFENWINFTKNIGEVLLIFILTELSLQKMLAKPNIFNVLKYTSPLLLEDIKNKSLFSFLYIFNSIIEESLCNLLFVYLTSPELILIKTITPS